MTEKIHKAKGLDSEFVILANKDVQRNDLSYDAIGMLSYLMSLPPDWTIYAETLKRTGCGRDKVRRILAELEKHGYLHIEKDTKDEQGRFSVNEYHAYAMPEYNPHFKPVTEKPSTVKPSTENLQLQRKEIKKEKNNKDSSVNKSQDEELQTMMALVKKELKQYGRTETVANALLCRLKGTQEKYNLDTPISPDELLQFVAWWDKNKKDRDGIILTRPRNLDSLQSNIPEWREKSKPSNQATTYKPVILDAPTMPQSIDNSEALAIIQSRKKDVSHESA